MIGPVVDVEFDAAIPPIYQSLHIKGEGDSKVDVIVEVQQHLGDHVQFRVALALDVQRLVDGRDRLVELNVDDRADHLHHATCVC